MERLYEQIQKHFDSLSDEEIKKEYEELMGVSKEKQMKKNPTVTLWLAVNRKNELYGFEGKPIYLDENNEFAPDTWLVGGCTMADSDYGVKVNEVKIPQITFEGSPIRVEFNTEYIIEE
jgi:hypothetical protein